MAFSSTIGNVLRKTSALSNSLLLQAVRCMSSSKLFVGGLSFATDEDSLKNAFSCYGDVLDVRVITDRDSGRSRGFGFITYSTTEDAAAAVTAMDGKELQGRTLKVDYANDRAGGIRRGGSSFTNGNGYATGGYGSGNGYATGGYGSGNGSGAGVYGNHGGEYAGSGGYSDGATGGGLASNYNSASGSTGGYTSSANYSDAATSGAYRGGYAGGNGGYSGGATSSEYASSHNNASGRGYARGNSGYGDGGTSGYVTNYNNTSTGGYVTNHNNTSGGKYVSENRGYGDEASGGYGYPATSGYATNSASGSNDNASDVGYGSSGSYTSGNPDGNTGWYNPPKTYGAGKQNTGAVGSGTFSEFCGDFSRGDSGSAGLNRANNFTGNTTGGSYNRSTTGGFSGGETMGFGSHKVQYNGQDDLLGENYFADKEAAGNI